MFEDDDIDKDIDVEVVLQILIDYCEANPYQGIMATEITYAHFVKHNNQINTMFNYNISKGFVGNTGNTSFHININEYNKRLRIKTINSVLDES